MRRALIRSSVPGLEGWLMARFDLSEAERASVEPLLPGADGRRSG